MRTDSLLPTPTVSPLLVVRVFGKPPVVRAAPEQSVVEYMFSTNVAVFPRGATSNLTLPSVNHVSAVPDREPVATTR